MLRKEAGGVLIYILMVFAILAVFVPVMMTMTSNSTLSVNRIQKQKYVNDLSVGGVESLIAYLNKYTSSNGTTSAYFFGYSGWGTFSLTTPEGQNVAFNMSYADNPSKPDFKYVTVTSTIGAGLTEVSKSLVYSIRYNSTGGGTEGGGAPEGAEDIIENGEPQDTTITFNPDSRDCVPIEPNRIFVQGSSPPEDDKDHNTFSNDPQINKDQTKLDTLIGNAITYYALQSQTKVTNQITQEASAYTTIENCSSLVGYSCASLNDVKNAINLSSNNPAVIQISSNITDNDNTSWTLGSATKTVHLIFNNITFNKTLSTFKVYGDLYANSFTLNQGGNVSITGTFKTNSANLYNSNTLEANNMYVMSSNYQIQGAVTIHDTLYAKAKVSVNTNQALHWGEAYIEGALDFNNGGSLTVDGTLYALSLTLNGGPTVSVGTLLTGGAFTVNDGVNFTANSDILVGSATFNDTTNISTSSGDFLVKGKMESNNQLNLDSGGNVAIGGNLTIWGSTNTIDTGGSTSQILLNGGTGGCSAGGSPWDPNRVG